MFTLNVKGDYPHKIEFGEYWTRFHSHNAAYNKRVRFNTNSITECFTFFSYSSPMLILFREHATQYEYGDEYISIAFNADQWSCSSSTSRQVNRFIRELCYLEKRFPLTSEEILQTIKDADFAGESKVISAAKPYAYVYPYTRQEMLELVKNYINLPLPEVK